MMKRLIQKIRNFRESEGFTLIEVVVALFVLTTGFLGVIGLLVMTIEKNRFAAQITEATSLAQDKIEMIANDGDVTTSGVTTESNITAMATSGGIYTRTTTISTSYYGVISDVTVNVSWSSGGTVHDVELKALVQP